MANRRYGFHSGKVKTERIELPNGLEIRQKAGKPTSGSSGDGAGVMSAGSLIFDTTNKCYSSNQGTKASPNWILMTSLRKFGNPTDGTSGDGAGFAEFGTELVNVQTNVKFRNIGTKASPKWMSMLLYKAGAPTSGTSGDGAGVAELGTLAMDITNGVVYVNSAAGGTKASPDWIKVGTQS